MLNFEHVFAELLKPSSVLTDGITCSVEPGKSGVIRSLNEWPTDEEMTKVTDEIDDR
jgi:hypothetical protein